MSADTTTPDVEDDVRPGTFQWAGRPTRRAMKIEATGQWVCAPGVGPLTIVADELEVEVVDTVEILDGQVAARTRRSPNWTEVDAPSSTTLTGVLDGLADDVAAEVVDVIGDDPAAFLAGDDPAKALTALDGVGPATATKIIDAVTAAAKES